MRFWLWNELGRWVGRAGRMFYAFGLWLSGLSGTIDAIADEHWLRSARGSNGTSALEHAHQVRIRGTGRHDLGRHGQR